MRFNTNLIVICLSAGLLVACGPHRENRQQNGQNGENHYGRPWNGHGVRRACAEDIEKYCASADRKRRCLRDNMDKLSPDCRTALQQAINNRRQGRYNENNNGNNNGNGNYNNGNQDDDSNGH